MKELCIFGVGGFAKEVFWLAKQCNKKVAAFIDIQVGEDCCGLPVKDEDFFDAEKHTAIIAVGDPHLRQKIADKLEAKYGVSIFDTLVAPSANLMSENIKIGYGAVICANCVLTGDIGLGRHAQLNLGTTIGHDTQVGDFFTTAPGVHISGKVSINDLVYFGTNTSSVEGISICSNVIIGAGACVVKNIIETGTYIGVPAKMMKGK